MLKTAGRSGAPDLGRRCIDFLKGTSLQEWHIAPLIEAYCRAGQVEEAVVAVNDLRRATTGDDHGPQLHTVLPLKDQFRVALEEERNRSDLEGPDETEVQQLSVRTPDGSQGQLRSLHDQGIRIDVTVFNACLLALIEDDQTHRALFEYKTAPSLLDVQPDIDTFNILLQGCIQAQHLVLGQQLLLEMQQQGIQPKQTTYELIIKLCLSVPADDRDTVAEAFGYLEALKSFGAIPSLDIYRSFLIRLAEVRHPRLDDLRREVEEFYGKALAGKASRIERGTTSSNRRSRGPRVI